MNRNNSHDRLEARTPLEKGSRLAGLLLDAEPRSCLAIRLAREHTSTAARAKLLNCDICGTFEHATCIPSLVGSEVIGSILVEHRAQLEEEDRELVRATVAQTAPTLGNLRNLALAESRALTDALTGLPNTRAVYDTLKRMVAQASRTLTPLSAILLDLDHFRQINDTHGHAKGDEALASVGDVLGNSLRASDFVGRYGGEEFLVLLPGTDKEDAQETAEKLRIEIGRLHVPGTEQPLTTSCGVATFPDDAQDPEQLLRLADSALYAAKAAGRNRAAVPALDRSAGAHANLAQMLIDEIDALTLKAETLTLRINELIAEIPPHTCPPHTRRARHRSGRPPARSGHRPLPVIARLDEITGIGPNAAHVIVAEVGLDMTQFPTPGHLVS